MNSKLVFVSLSLLTLIALSACNKKDEAAPAAPPASQSSQSGNPDLAGAANKASQQVSNAVDGAKSTVDSTVKSAGDTVNQLKDAAPAGVNTVLPNATLPTASTTPPATVPTSPDKPQSLLDQATSGIGNLSQDQVVQGLKEALAKGLEKSVANLGQDGGFLTNLNVKIPVPEKMKKVESVLRTLKQDKLVDDFVTTMNHAAEQAVPVAASVFADALKQMSIDDAKNILAGPNDAATRYFQKTTQTNLYARFYPIVQKATEKTGVTSTYKAVCEKANAGESLGGFGSSLVSKVFDKDSLDIDAYVTNKALDGLFKLIADEELKIRQNPIARTTETLQKVFGAIKL